VKNFALRKVFLILTEKIARLENLYNSKLADERIFGNDFITSCQRSLDKLKAEILQNKLILLESYSEKTLEDAKIQKVLSSLEKCITGFLELHSLLSYLPSNYVIPETGIFLNNVLKNHHNLCGIKSNILLSPDFLTRDTHKDLFELIFPCEIASNTLTLYLPIMESSDPLYWVILSKKIFAHTDKIRINPKLIADRLFEERNINLEDRALLEKLAYELTSDLFTVKLFGPAYYYLMLELGTFRSIAESKKRHNPTLAIREELIYNELKKVSMADELAQAHEWFAELSRLSEKLHSILGFEFKRDNLLPLFNELMIALDREVSEKLEKSALFNEKDYKKSLQAYDRLNNDVLISSSYIHDIDNIRNDYEKACKEPEESFNIYEHLNKFKEDPNTPQQIVNAGWMYKDNTTDKVFFDFLSNDYGPANLGLFPSYTTKLDNNLVKSIETLVIHKVLLNED